MPYRALILCAQLAAVSAFVQRPDSGSTGKDGERGRRMFEAQCARCHGMKGTGGIGPGLNRARLRRAGDDEALVNLIREGVPGTEMAYNWQMSDREIRQVASFVRSLARTEATPVPGDPAKGKALYDKHGCSVCHAVRGQGGGFGPELTDVGARRGAAHLRQALVDPGSTKVMDSFGFLAYLPIQVALHDGRVVRGLRVNEDSFSLQILDADRRLHSFDKQELAETKREPDSSVMPSCATTLSGDEIDDLVAYLAGLQGE
jgi:putative heme-binding domain-containing protein